ncbi:MAG: sugar phosphate nucleotidyltransferase [Candidatus Paceibacterota bacterium]
MKKISTLIVPAAGAGTRLRPMTFFTPKELLRLVDKPIFYYLIAEAHTAGIKNILFVVHKQNRQLPAFLKSSAAKQLLKEFTGIKVGCVITNRRDGDAQAILAAKKFIKPGQVFAVSMGDLLSLPGTSLLRELKDAYKICRGSVISVKHVPRALVSNFGNIDPEKVGKNLYRVRRIIEKPLPKDAPSTLAMTGKYVLDSDIFPLLQKIVDSREPDQEARLSKCLDVYAKTNSLFAYVTKDSHYDTGNKLALAQTELIFSLAHQGIGKQLKEAIKKYAR